MWMWRKHGNWLASASILLTSVWFVTNVLTELLAVSNTARPPSSAWKTNWVRVTHVEGKRFGVKSPCKYSSNNMRRPDQYSSSSTYLYSKLAFGYFHSCLCLEEVTVKYVRPWWCTAACRNTLVRFVLSTTIQRTNSYNKWYSSFISLKWYSNGGAYPKR